MDNDKDKEKLKCGECRFYSEEWKECCYGGGFGWYPNPDDECELGFTKLGITKKTSSDNGKFKKTMERHLPCRWH